MLRFVLDADVPGALRKGLRRHHGSIDVIRVHEAGLRTAPDDKILEWAAQNNRILVSRDPQTMIRAARDRLASGQPMPGLLVLKENCQIGLAIEQIAIVAECSRPDEVTIEFLPF